MVDSKLPVNVLISIASTPLNEKRGGGGHSMTSDQALQMLGELFLKGKNEIEYIEIDDFFQRVLSEDRLRFLQESVIRILESPNARLTTMTKIALDECYISQ